MYRILIVEDDATIATIVSKELSNWGYETKRTENFESVMEDFLSFSPQLVLLDLSLPFRSGFHWCAAIREISKVPIVFVSSAADNMNLVTALHQGADDFIAKPFDLAVLVAKVQALLRRTYDFGDGEIAVLSHRGLLLNSKDASILFNEAKIDLTANEYKIMLILMQNKGKVVTREEIMRSLWEDESFIDDNTLTVNITRIRKKLAEAGLADFITTKKGLGYMIEE